MGVELLPVVELETTQRGLGELMGADEALLHVFLVAQGVLGELGQAGKVPAAALHQRAGVPGLQQYVNIGSSWVTSQALNCS